MCCRREGNRQARSQVTVHQRALVVRVICVRSNRNGTTWHFWSTIRLATLAASADFPTPGEPLIQITLGPSTFLISFSISCKMVVRVPSIHDLDRESLFSLRALTKSSSSFLSAAAFAFFAMVADTNDESVKLYNEYIRYENQTLLCKDLYQKIPVKISCETI